jgi:hypothetical protein
MLLLLLLLLTTLELVVIFSTARRGYESRLSRNGVEMQRTPQFITGDFEPHWCFLPDDEYSRALDALVKVIALFAHASLTVRMCGASRDVFTIHEIESSSSQLESQGSDRATVAGLRLFRRHSGPWARFPAGDTQSP